MPPDTGRAPEPVGATPLNGPKRKGAAAWLVPLALAVLLVVVVLLLLTRCGGGDDDTAASSTTTPTTASTSASPSGSTSATASAGSTDGAGAGAGVSGAAGTITAGGKTLLPLSSADAVTSFAGQDATTTSVVVESVPADEGFWVGTGPQDRVWVQLSGAAGESPFAVRAGDKVAFTGKVTENPGGFASTVGLTAAEGAALLDQQGAHIAVPRSALKLSS